VSDASPAGGDDDDLAHHVRRREGNANVSDRRQPFALAVIVAATAAHVSAVAPQTAPISPGGGAASSPRPVFVAIVSRGDLPEEIQVATSPTMTRIGFRANVGYCFPVRSGTGRVRCSLDAALRPGTYYWTLVYQRNSRCIVHGGHRYCFPEPHLTGPTRFTVREPAP
jgi:hypothetical protein